MLLSALALPLLLQVGPAPSTSPVTAVPEELYEQRQLNKARDRAQVVVRDADPVQACFARADTDAEAARAEAFAVRAGASGIDRAVAGHCLGYALSRLERWGDAAEAFAEARRDAPQTHAGYRARLGAAAGAALLASGQPDTALEALSALDPADDPSLATTVALDRARALVALDMAAAAESLLAETRAADQDSAEAWLLSATLARRLDKLAEAQAFIERAAILRPFDADIGLEAGVIAVLSGREDAAMRSWQSVIDAAPGTQAALTAQQYLAQLRGE